MNSSLGISPIDRFFDKVRLPNDPDQCWEWAGGMSYGKYGSFYYQGKMIQAHKFSYLTFVGPIPIGKQLGHSCHNRRCVHPWHVRPITFAENVNESSNQNKDKTHCINGHPFDGDNLKVVWNAAKKYWMRVCLTCYRRRHREYKRRLRRLYG